MSKLSKRATNKLFIAESCFHRIADDDSFIDDCCYNLQQSIELSLKYLVEIHGEQYAANHDIRSNLNKLERMGIGVPCKEKLRALASTLYSWETESRYRDDFVALTEDITDAFACARALAEFSAGLTSQELIQ